MSLYRPRKPSQGSGAPSQFLMFCISVWEMLFNGKFPFQDTNTVKWKKSANGYSAEAIMTAGAGGAGRSGWDWMYPTHKELDTTYNYTIGKWVYISKLNTLVTSGMTDIVSNTNVISCQGLWECCQDVPPASGGKFNVPVFPYPVGAAMVGGSTFLQGTTAPSGSPLIGDLDLVDPTTGQKILYWIYRGDI